MFELYRASDAEVSRLRLSKDTARELRSTFALPQNLQVDDQQTRVI